MAKKIGTAIVVGASSGIGAALVRALAARGARVAAVARRGDELEKLAARINAKAGDSRVLCYPHDVANAAEVPELFQRITAELGGLDAVFFAAGLMPKVAVNEFSSAKDLEMITVNFAGAVAWLNEAATRFERTRSGYICGIGSIAGDRGRRGNPVYGASKAGLAHYLEALHTRLARYGVGVTTIKPGFVDTAMTKGMPGLFWVASPKQAAEAILSATLAKRREVYVLGRWRLVAFVVKNFPTFLFKYLSI